MQQNKKVNWIVEPCLFDEIGEFKRYNEFINIINKNGDNIGKNYHDPQTCLSSLSTARDYGFYDNKVFNVASYINYIPEWYINSDCLFVPFGLLKKDIFKNQIFEKFRYSDKLFIKSNSGFKLLTGFSVKKSDWDKEISFLNLLDDDIMVISSHKDIEKEYRFWVINNEIITWSSYSWDDVEYENTIVDYIYETAKIIAKQIKLNQFTLDLCLIKNNFTPFVVEINNIYTSGTYDCDLEKLYVGLRDLAIKEYEDLNTI